MSCELAWAAGFFDGEGSVGLYASGRGFYGENPPRYPKVTIANTEVILLERFRLAVGVGKVYGPKVCKNPKWKDRYDYRLDGVEKVGYLFMILKPYLGPTKFSKFEEALAPYSNRQRDESQTLVSVSSNLTGATK